MDRVESQLSADQNTPAEIKRDIERTRAEIDQTVNELIERLKPRHLIDDLLNMFARKTDPEGTDNGVAQSLRGFGSALLGKVKQHTMPPTVTDRISGVTDRARGAMSGAGEQMRQSYRAGAQTLSEVIDDAPLALGVAALAAGLVAGMLLPRTRREDELLGGLAAGLKDQPSHQAPRSVCRHLD